MRRQGRRLQCRLRVSIFLADPAIDRGAWLGGDRTTRSPDLLLSCRISARPIEKSEIRRKSRRLHPRQQRCLRYSEHESDVFRFQVKDAVQFNCEVPGSSFILAALCPSCSLVLQRKPVGKPSLADAFHWVFWIIRDCARRRWLVLCMHFEPSTRSSSEIALAGELRKFDPRWEIDRSSRSRFPSPFQSDPPRPLPAPKNIPLYLHPKSAASAAHPAS